jgi:hypothetical protein
MHRHGTVHVIVLQECGRRDGRQLAPRLCRFDAQEAARPVLVFCGSETGPNKNDPKIPDGQRIADIDRLPNSGSRQMGAARVG